MYYESGEYRLHSVLILDDDVTTTKSFARLLKEVYEVYVANNMTQAKNILEKKEITILICDYSLKDGSGVDFLRSLNENILTRKILLSGKLDLQATLESINDAKVHKVKQKPWDPVTMLDELELLAQEYDNIKSTKTKLKEYDKMMSETHRLSDDILDILSNLDENNKLGEFISSVIKSLDGIQSFISMNFQTYLYFKDKMSFQHVLKYLTDIELIANQYDQKILLIYAMTLRGYFLALMENLSEAILYISGAREYSNFIDPKYKNNTLTQTLDQFYAPGSATSNLELYEQHLELNINKLIKIPINEMMIVNDKLFAFIQGTNPLIDYFLVVRSDIPLFSKSGQGRDLEPSLISGFLVALSQFLSETVPGGGDIHHIDHQRGVILIHKHLNYLFIVLSSIDDLWLRVSLRDFAEESTSIFDNVPDNYYVTNEESNQITKLLEKYFGKF